MAGSYGMRQPSKQTTFFVLMVASAILLLLPWEILGRLRKMTGLVATPQLVATQMAQGLTDSIDTLAAPSISPEEHAKLVSRLDALQNENASFAVYVKDLEAQIADLTKIRELNGFPQQGRLIPARVIAADALASRGSLNLSKGSLSNVKPGDWVTSRRFVDAGTGDGIHKGAGVLVRESLIGWVEETDAFTSRVVLLSDKLSRARMLVRIERGETKGNRLVVSLNDKPANFSLEGAGQGMMRIPDLDARWVEKQLIKEGDLVISDPNDAKLPVAMVIGKITQLVKVRDDKKKPLYYTAQVKHLYEPRTMGQVYIADFSRQGG